MSQPTLKRPTARWIVVARRCAAMILAVVAPIGLGCATTPTAKMPTDPLEVLSANPSRSDVQQASFQQEQPKTAAESLSIGDFAPEKLGKTTKKLIGQGPNREAAQKIYQEAEEIFKRASEMQGEQRAATFIEAGAKFAQAAERYPDSALQQDSLYMAGDCYFFADAYPKANEYYEQLIKAFPNNRYLDVVEQRRFTIAKYWIDVNDKSPEQFYSLNFFDKVRPWRDTRGHALRVFDRIRVDDPTGRLADDATLAAGNERFAKGEFAKAEEFYGDLRRNYPTSEHQFDAHFLGLKAKLLTYRGADYNGTTLEDSEKLIKQMRRQFPNEAAKEQQFLDRSFAEVRYKKAERTWNHGAYYDNRGEYRAAAIHYNTVVRDFADTPFGERAQARIKQIETLPPVPPQKVPWLVGLFPEHDKIKPLVEAASKPKDTVQR